MSLSKIPKYIGPSGRAFNLLKNECVLRRANRIDPFCALKAERLIMTYSCAVMRRIVPNMFADNKGDPIRLRNRNQFHLGEAIGSAAKCPNVRGSQREGDPLSSLLGTQRVQR